MRVNDKYQNVQNHHYTTRFSIFLYDYLRSQNSPTKQKPSTMIKPALLTASSSLSHPPRNPNPYIYKIIPVNTTTTTTTTNHTTHIAAISSDDSLRLLDARILHDININPIPNPVHEGVTCLQSANENGWGSLVWTAGRDGVVRGFDLRVGDEKKKKMMTTMELSSSDG